MEIEKYNKIIKLLREKGAKFSQKYDEICAKVKNKDNANYTVKVEGVFSDESLVDSTSTGSNEILTRITIQEGKTKTLFIVRNIEEGSTAQYAEGLYYSLARFKVKKKSLIFTREEKLDFNITKTGKNDFELHTVYQKNPLVASVLAEVHLSVNDRKLIDEGCHATTFDKK